MVNFSVKGQTSQYFSLFGPVVSAATPQLYHYGARADRDSEYDCVSKVFYENHCQARFDPQIQMCCFNMYRGLYSSQDEQMT